MAETYIHGVSVVESDDGARPIRTAASAVIGIVGTASEADALLFPLNTPVLIAGSRKEAVTLGVLGTLPQAIDSILDQGGALIVVIRIEEGLDAATTMANVIGGVDAVTGDYTGMQAWLGAKSVIGFQPRILIAPGFSNQQAIATEMFILADNLRGFAYIDGPNTNDAEAQTYVGNFGGKRGMVIDPWVKAFDVLSASEVVRPGSAVAAGLRAKIDTEKGFWWSMSNQNINGIIGTVRPVDFKMGSRTARANLLNENHVTTIIREDGWRMWGSRTCNTIDPKWAFEPVVRTADLIADSIQDGLMWAVDRPINARFLEDVALSVNNYIRHLVKIGALIGGECWVDPDLNAPDQLEQGKVYFKYDFTAPAPAEQIGITSVNVSDYYAGILPTK
jgi:phage tail sheath protein FI